jgi:hypothetical protein
MLPGENPYDPASLAVPFSGIKFAIYSSGEIEKIFSGCLS